MTPPGRYPPPENMHAGSVMDAQRASFHNLAVLRPSRRELLKAGLLGSALLAGAHLAASVPAARAQAAPALVFMTPSDVTIMRAVAPVVLDGALPAGAEGEAALDEVIAGMDRSISRLAPAVQQEVRDMFDLLGLAPARMLVLGLWDGWATASPQAVAEAMAGLRDSRFAIKRSIYSALRDLPVSSWYGNPKSWARIGYDGPPQVRQG